MSSARLTRGGKRFPGFVHTRPGAGQEKAPKGSLTEVSRRAGVSIATASRVLNRSSHPVADGTRERVLAAAEELGYSPSALARALVTQRSRIIGVIVGDIVDPYFAEITRGIEDVGAKAGYLTIVCNADRRTELEQEQLRLLTDYHAEGVIFAGQRLRRRRAGHGARGARRPGAFAGHERAVARHARLRLPARSVDNRAAAYDLTDYLISLGHRWIAFIAGPPGLHIPLSGWPGSGRHGARRASRATPSTTGDFSYDLGHAAAVHARRGGLPDAVIGANDETAIGAITALRQAGVAIPEDVSVAGMTDTRLARFSDLTTVNIPLYQFGAIAARRVIAGERNA